MRRQIIETASGEIGKGRVKPFFVENLRQAKISA
jgi:hypothetical protein